MGYTEVFLHVGDQARIQAPGGKWVAPLVTGTTSIPFHQTADLTNLPQEHLDLGNAPVNCR